jgi:NADP-dependent 3-hydroxy acid dehydrogenase YdfG
MTTNKQVVVITGGSAGIGAAIAKRLHDDGFALVLAARRADELARVAAELGDDVLSVVTDVTRPSDLASLRDQGLAHFGRIDVWINNAGRGIAKPALALTSDDVDDMMLVNVKSVLWGMQAVVPHFQSKNAGHIINVSSFLSKVPVASVRSMYSAAKAAMNSLTANVRMDLAVTHPGIRVSTLIPGIVLTEFGTNAGGAPSSAPPGAPPFMKAQTAVEVADVTAQLIAEPSAEAYTNPAQAGVAATYVSDVGAFETRRR